MASGTCLEFRVQSEMQLAVLRLPDTAAGLYSVHNTHLNCMPIHFYFFDTSRLWLDQTLTLPQKLS